GGGRARGRFRSRRTGYRRLAAGPVDRRFGGRGRTTLSRRFLRQDRDGARPGDGRGRASGDAPGLAGARAARPPSPRRAQSGESLGSSRTLALRPRQTLQPRTARSAAARIDVRAGTLGYGALFPSDSPAPADAERRRLGACGQTALAAIGGRAYRRRDEITLRAGAARQAPRRAARSGS